MENNKQRSEQNTKNILAKMLHVAYAFVQKLFPEGHLIDVNGSTGQGRKNINMPQRIDLLWMNMESFLYFQYSITFKLLFVYLFDV